MIYVESPSTDPFFNLALEELLFSSAGSTESCLMLWQNERSIIVGRFQNTAEEVDRAFVDANGIAVARRLSGGGAVYHDLGNLNYTIIVNADEATGYDFSFFSRMVARALEPFGVEAEVSGRNDLTIGGRKFSGSSQYVKKGRILHHGCIMLDTDLAAVAGALKPRDIKFASKAVKSVRSRVTTVNACAKEPVALEAFKQELAWEVARGGGIEKRAFNEEQLEAAARLRAEKYATWEWNWGASPAYSLSNALKFPAGIVEAGLDVASGAIKRIKISGDFFGDGDIAELERAIEGLPLDEQLEEALLGLGVERYLHGITAAELAQVIRG